MPSVYTEEWKKAKKVHKCCECGLPIMPGETYQLFKGCYEGKWERYKTCRECNDLRHELESDGEMPPFGHLAEWASEASMIAVKEDKFIERLT